MHISNCEHIFLTNGREHFAFVPPTRIAQFYLVGKVRGEHIDRNVMVESLMWSQCLRS
jgi:hypothetical protein